MSTITRTTARGMRASTIHWIATSTLLLFMSTASASEAPRSTPEANALPDCNCYFASDCRKWFGDKTICDRNEGNGGSGGKETECKFMKPKPNKRTDEKGCSDSNDGKPSTCDGHCVKPDKGSFCGDQDWNTVATSVELWSEAFLQPAGSGGGIVNQDLVAQAQNLGLPKLCTGQIARTVLSLMELTWSDILGHPDRPHKEQDHQLPNLSDDACRLGAAHVTARALADAIRRPGLTPALADEIGAFCAHVLPFADPCENDNAIECVETSILDMATYLTTPKTPSQQIISSVLNEMD